MSGLRQGELIALRCMDVDWMQRCCASGAATAARRGAFEVAPFEPRRIDDGPSSRRTGSALPVLRVHCRRRSVFGHPVARHPPDASKLRKRMGEAMKTAGIGERWAARADHLPLAQAHARNVHGCGRGAAPHVAGMNGPRRLRHDRFKEALARRACGQFASPTCVTPSARAWLQPERPCLRPRVDGAPRYEMSSVNADYAPDPARGALRTEHSRPHRTSATFPQERPWCRRPAHLL